MAQAELKTLGRYNIERVLGKGAMGVVYEGLDPRLGRRVAIKTILKANLDEDTGKDFAMRFVREAQAVARLNHPNIVQVYDFGEEQEIAYIVMEFIRGKELKNFFDANERFDLKEAVRIMCELCDALDFAHQAGIVHRDIKPANVMIDSQARTKLTDFGVARVQDNDKTSVEKTQAGTMVGTPAYMSPEQITGGNVDKRSDVFSAGIILYQFLTGEKPFTGSGAWTIAKKIIQEDPPAPSTLNNAVTPLFDSVVNKALAKNPEERFQSAKELGAALKAALEGRGLQDDADKTVIGGGLDIDLDLNATVVQRPGAPRPAAASGTGGTVASQAGSQEVELEFWRAIKDGNDPDDFELYVQQFPNGIYSALAKRKIAKLKGNAGAEETSVKAREQEKKEAEEAARREAEARTRLAEEKEKLELELAKREEEFKRREEEAERQRIEAAAEAERAKQEAAAERERAKAEAKAEAERARQEAAAEAEKAKQEAAAERERARAEAAAAAEKAKQDAAAELAKREAEYKKREAEVEAKRQAEAKQQAELRAKQEAEAKLRREADEKLRKEQEAKAKAEREAEAKKALEERAKREAEFKKREAELKAEAAKGGKRLTPTMMAGIGLVVVAVAGGAYFLSPKEDPEAQAKLEAMQKQLADAKAAQDKAAADLAKAREAEEAARKAGNQAEMKRLAEERSRAEAEAKKTADAAKAREADAKKGEESAKVAKERAEKDKVKADADKARAEQIAREKAEREKATAEAAAREKAAADKQLADARAAAERAKAEAEKIRVDAEKARADAEKARADAEAARRAAETKIASAPPAAAAGTADGETLYEQALALEKEGKGREAVRLYTQAAKKASGKAAKRLGDIYEKGLIGVSRDYAEGLKWYNVARALGEDVPLQQRR